MRSFLSISVLFLASVSASGAELSLLGGYRTGGPSVEVLTHVCIASPCPQPTVDARDGESFGLILDLPLRERLMFEVLLSDQSGEFEDPDFAVPEVSGRPLKPRFDLTYLHLGLLRQWRTGKASPFAAVGLGIAQLEADQPYFTLSEDRLSASLAGGVKLHLNDWLGIRVEGRGYWADMPRSTGEDLFQIELSSGLTFNL